MDSGSSFLPETRDAKENHAIHTFLFQDIYDCAGEIRTVDIRRGDGEFFAPHINIAANLENLSAHLADKNNLKNLARSDFVQELVHFYDDLDEASRHAREDSDFDMLIGILNHVVRRPMS